MLLVTSWTVRRGLGFCFRCPELRETEPQAQGTKLREAGKGEGSLSTRTGFQAEEGSVLATTNRGRTRTNGGRTGYIGNIRTGTSTRYQRPNKKPSTIAESPVASPIAPPTVSSKKNRPPTISLVASPIASPIAPPTVSTKPKPAPTPAPVIPAPTPTSAPVIPTLQPVATEADAPISAPASPVAR
jgi:hypothetical protein